MIINYILLVAESVKINILLKNQQETRKLLKLEKVKKFKLKNIKDSIYI